MFRVMELEQTGSLRNRHLRISRSNGPRRCLLPDTSENGTLVAEKRKCPPKARFENGTFVADDWNCRRNLHPNQIASSSCPVEGLSPRFSFGSAQLPFRN